MGDSPENRFYVGSSGTIEKFDKEEDTEKSDSEKAEEYQESQKEQ